MVILIHDTFTYARESKLTFIMISREATVGGKCEARKLRAVRWWSNSNCTRPRVYNYVDGVNSLSASMRAAGSGVGCTRSVNNAALDSRTQFPRAADVPRAKCEETRTRARKISVISQRGYVRRL